MSEDFNNDLTNLTGKAMKFGPYMNTDIIIPSQYLEFKDPKDYCKYVMYQVRPTAWEEIQDQGATIFIAGEDFGSGSSREQAPDAIIAAGVSAVVAESFASIFYRNSINVGLPILEVPGITENISEGDEVKVNLEKGEVTNLTTNETYEGDKIEEFLLNKLRKGGLIPELQAYVKENNL